MHKSKILPSNALTRRNFIQKLLLISGTIATTSSVNLLLSTPIQAHTRQTAAIPAKNDTLSGCVNVWSADNHWLPAKFILKEQRFIS